MKVSELMLGYTPNPSYKGAITPDDWVFAIGTTSDADVSDFIVAQGNIIGIDASMNTSTQDTQYIREGQSTTKVNTQPTYKVTGDRYVGNDFQDFCLSHKMVYSIGADAVVPYVYFNVRNGMGERGTASVVVNSTSSGNAGETSGFDVDFTKYGAMPEEYTYTFGGGSAVLVTGVTISQSTVSVDVGDVANLTATVSPITATNKAVTWSSSDPSVAMVTTSGEVEGVSTGTTVITVTTVDGGYTDTCDATVI